MTQTHFSYIQIMSRAVLFIFVIANSILYAQYNQASGNVWVFGDGVKVDFNSAPPQVQIGFSASTLESCASIADCDGNLLFYIIQIKCLIKSKLMSNGGNLIGDSSSTNGSLIAPVLVIMTNIIFLLWMRFLRSHG